MKIDFLDTIIFRTPTFPVINHRDEALFDEGIYVTSPALHSEYRKFLANKKMEKKEIEKLTSSIYKYQSRSSYRCTPFGLFAGIGVGSFSDKNNIVLNSDFKASLFRKTRLDMNVVCYLAQKLSKNEILKSYLKFSPNTSIYKIDDFYRYVEYYYINNHRVHKISKVDYSTFLETIFESSKNGKTLSELVQLLVCDDITHEEAEDFINELVAAQLIISELEPTITGPDFFDSLINSITTINLTIQSDEIIQIISVLRKVQNKIVELDSNGLSEIIKYQEIFEELKLILPDLNEKNLFQVDSFKKPIKAELNSDIKKDLIEVIKLLNKITPKYQNNNLEEFKKRFEERFEHSEVPLSLALDPETGIGYPNKDVNGINELIDDMLIFQQSDETNIKWNKLQSCLLQILMHSIKENKSVISLSGEEFDEIDFTTNQLPPSFNAMIKIIDSETNKFIYKGIGGSSALNLIGRFTHGNENINKIAEDITKFEKNELPSDCIYAEIVHLPEARTGNILSHQTFRDYEIPYLAKSTVDLQNQINVDDLYISLVANKIILRSKKTNKQIIPRLSNAHNFSYNALPIYHFLCDMQTQWIEKPFLSFNWGIMSNQFEFLPRVEYKNSILSLAKWQLKKKSIDSLFKNITSADKIYLKVKEKYNLPKKFLIIEADNELLIDSENEIAVKVFVDYLKTKNDITLEEYLFDEASYLVKDDLGNSYTNEFLIFMLNRESQKINKLPPTKALFKSTKNFVIGSSWLYYKIYCGTKTADHILTSKLKPILEDLINENKIDSWFFIRYADPEKHIRVRLNILNADYYTEIISRLNVVYNPLLENKIISKVQTDTYVREIERYGDNSMKLSEHIFFIDSSSCLEALDLLDPETGDKYRWYYAIACIDRFLSDFGQNTEAKFNFTQWHANSFFEEHGGGKNLKLQLDDKFRKLRKELDSVFMTKDLENMEFYPLIEIIDKKSKLLSEYIKDLKKLEAENQLEIELNSLLSSYIHMMVNRIFATKQRTNEFVLYDLLARNYKSLLARNKKENLANIQ